MKITTETITRTAQLAKLELCANETEIMREKLENIILSTAVFDEVDTNKIVPLTHLHSICNILREDEPTPSLDREEILKNAPCRNDDCFVVPKTVE